MIYLDYSATTPVNKEVLDSFNKATIEYVGNPNSLHSEGIKANNLIKECTNTINKLLNIEDYDVIYTSGASEANNTVIKGIMKYENRGKHIISTELEHSSVIGPLNYLSSIGYEVEFVNLDDNGLVDLDDLENKLRDDTVLVSIASVNSEVGISQNIENIRKIIDKYPKCLFHSDITQSIGKEHININLLDFATMSAQKIYGMKGVGLLLKKKKLSIIPLIHGGKSTTIYRSGTPATPLIVSLTKALKIAIENIDENISKVKEINKYLKDKLSKLDVVINSKDIAIYHVVNFSVKNIKPEVILTALSDEDIYISTQTACSKSEYSKAVYALTKDKELSQHSLRVSLSHLTTKEEIDKFIESLERIINNLK